MRINRYIPREKENFVISVLLQCKNVDCLSDENSVLVQIEVFNRDLNEMDFKDSTCQKCGKTLYLVGSNKRYIF